MKKHLLCAHSHWGTTLLFIGREMFFILCYKDLIQSSGKWELLISLLFCMEFTFQCCFLLYTTFFIRLLITYIHCQMEWDCNNKEPQYFKNFSEKCLLLEIFLFTIELNFFHPLWMQRKKTVKLKQKGCYWASYPNPPETIGEE